MDKNTRINRREFLKLSALGLGALAFRPTFRPMMNWLPQSNNPFPDSLRLGRVFAKVDVKARPDKDAVTVNTLYDDAVVPWLREVVGSYGRFTNRKWVETADGYIYAPDLQPVQNHPNDSVKSLPQKGDLKGMWVEVTVPFVELTLINPPASPYLKLIMETTARPRFYYSQVFWVDDMKTADDGTPLYRVGERHGGYSDVFWADARAFRPLTDEELSPISPNVEDKKIVVNVSYQTMACYEGKTEVFFDRISSGGKFDYLGNPTDKYSTPLGLNHVVNRKYISLHMEGGSAASGTGYDMFGVSWTSIFSQGGVAVHSTYWHNNYGETMSHGCVNATPDASKFVYRWTKPEVPYPDGKVEVSGYVGTKVEVIE